jgi:hypothetical protein
MQVFDDRVQEESGWNMNVKLGYLCVLGPINRELYAFSRKQSYVQTRCAWKKFSQWRMYEITVIFVLHDIVSDI